MRKLDAYPPADPREVVDRGYVDVTARGAGAVLPPSQRIVVPVGILSNAGAALVAGRGTFHPYPVAAGSYDALVINVTTPQSNDGSVVAKVALYPDDGTGGMPNTAGGSAAVATLPALTSTGPKIATLATTWTPTATALYWAHLVYVVTTAPGTTAQVSCVANCTYAIPSTTALFTSRIRGWARTGLSDVPSDATTVANATGSGSNDIPIVALRRL